MLKPYNVNTRIHEERQKYGVYLWEIAERYGVSETQMYRLLRRELPKEKQDRIIQIIKDIAEDYHDSKSA